MSRIEDVRKILDILKEDKTLVCLSNLAKQSGFPSVANRHFKDALNFLIKKQVIKVRQSGWPSEKRGGNNHPKTVILIGDIYETGDLDLNITSEKLIGLEKAIGNSRQSTLSLGKKLTKKTISALQNCQDCIRNPVVYITKEQIPICDKHWTGLARTDIEW